VPSTALCVAQPPLIAATSHQKSSPPQLVAYNKHAWVAYAFLPPSTVYSWPWEAIRSWARLVGAEAQRQPLPLPQPQPAW